MNAYGSSISVMFLLLWNTSNLYPVDR